MPVTAVLSLQISCSTQHLTVANLVNRSVLTNMNVQPIRLHIHRLHAIGCQDAMFLGEIRLRKCLFSHPSS
jgi:hypothetical protein